jgi:AcrR family transcriptional regulator
MLFWPRTASTLFVTSSSVDEIAESAGFSRGAFYSNFKSKDELFLTVVEREIRARSLETRDIVSASASAEETLLSLRKFYVALQERDKDAALLIAEARLYAAQNGQFKSKLSALFREVHEELKSVLERFQTEAGIKNGIPADQLVLIAIALNQGLAMHHLMDPKHYPDHLVTASSELVFDKLMGFTGSDVQLRRSRGNPPLEKTAVEVASRTACLEGGEIMGHDAYPPESL